MHRTVVDTKFEPLKKIIDPKIGTCFVLAIIKFSMK